MKSIADIPMCLRERTYCPVWIVTARKDTELFQANRDNRKVKEGDKFYVTHHSSPGHNELLVPCDGEYWFDAEDFEFADLPVPQENLRITILSCAPDGQLHIPESEREKWFDLRYPNVIRIPSLTQDKP